MSTTKIAEVLEAIEDGLKLRDGLAGVGVSAAYLGPEWMGQQTSGYIMLYSGSVTQKSLGQGETDRKEDMSIQGELCSIVPGYGADAAETARDNAAALLGEIESFIAEDFDLGDVALGYELDTYDFDTGIWGGSPPGLFFQINFTLRIVTHIEP